jgi:hypothetical protein
MVVKTEFVMGKPKIVVINSGTREISIKYKLYLLSIMDTVFL